MGERALIGLGSNLGDRRAILDAAIASLASTSGVEVRAVSSYYETAAVGGPPGQGSFLNAVALLDTTQSAFELHGRLRAIEWKAGRVRVVRWGERTLDLDLLLFDELVLEGDGLVLPHPRMAFRRFVLAPAAEIAPELIHPVYQITIAKLLENIDRRPSFLVLIGPFAFDFFRPLVESLPASGLVEDDGSEFSYSYLTDLLHDANFPSILSQKSAEWRASRWSSEFWGDKWIISDFWFDDLYRQGEFQLDKSESWRTIFLEARKQVLQPTLLVATHPYTYMQMRLYLDRHESECIGREVPILWPGSKSMDAMLAEIPEGENLIQRRSGEEFQFQLREILAACAASRALCRKV
jgi:2-amino-4-hydroxy-6-hydroxymethyldihydropteridine diphosphokinase